MAGFNDYQDIYAELGIDTADLGCVMLDLEPFSTKRFLPNDILYTSPNPKHFWINGWVADKPHTTLKYGLLRPATEWASYIHRLLGDWTPPETVRIRAVTSFPSPYPDEPYSCVVAVLNTMFLQTPYNALSYLPHIDTNSPYIPHVTLAYVNKEDESAVVSMLDAWLKDVDVDGRGFRTLGLNLGGNDNLA